MFDQALRQYDDWIEIHSEDSRLPVALNQRCWLRAIRGVQLPLALKDCNAAYGRLDQSNPERAAELRLNKAAEGQADIDRAKALAPRLADDAAQRGIVP